MNEEVKFEQDIWKTVSNSAKDLLKQMLLKDPKERIEPASALTHEFFKEEAKLSMQNILEKYRIAQGYMRECMIRRIDLDLQNILINS